MFVVLQKQIVGMIGYDVKERLAIAIKQIVEKNKASFAFPSQSIYVEKNDCYFLFSFTIIKTLFLCGYCKRYNKLVNCI